MQFATPLSSAALTPSGILVVDDHDLVRLGLRTLIQSYAASSRHVVDVYEARNLQDALALYQQHQASIGLVLLDLHLPDAHGLSALIGLRGRFPSANVVVLSGFNDPALAAQAKAAGASAYLTKSGDLQDVVQYVRVCGVFSPSSAEPAVPAHAITAAQGTRVVRTLAGDSVALTTRQAQVLDYILAGQPNRSIAAAMYLSEGTVKNHVSTLLLLFGVASRAQLISQLR